VTVSKLMIVKMSVMDSKVLEMRCLVFANALDRRQLMRFVIKIADLNPTLLDSNRTKLPRWL
jgi:hypothetical protein